mgnify:CR=1 FL=1
MLNRLVAAIYIAALLVPLGALESQAQQNGKLVPAIVKCSGVPIRAGLPDSLAVYQQNIFLGVRGGVLTAFENSKLETLWRTDLGGEFASGLDASSGNIVLVTNPSMNGSITDRHSTIRLLSATSGITIWSTQVPYSDNYWVAVRNDKVFALGSGGDLSVLDRVSGEVIRQIDSLGKIRIAPSFSSTAVVFSTVDRELVILSLSDLEVVQRASFDFGLTYINFTQDDGIVAGDERGHLFRFGENITTSRPSWRFKSGGAVSFASYSTSGIFMTSFDNFVYLLSDYNGDVIWKRRLTGRMNDGGIFVNGAVVVVVPGDNVAFIFDQKTGRLKDSIANSDREIIVSAPFGPNDRRFVMAFADSLEIFGISGCEYANGKATP